jgi:hypothetical protein
MNDYEKQASDFLKKFGIKFRATLSDSKPAPWDDGKDQRHHYRITLSGDAPGKADVKRRLVFDFWGSIADAKAKKHPTAYDVLACISGDVNCSETFEDFCSEYGESSDSIRALQTFKRCSSFAKRLQNFFTAEELEALQEIQ